MYSVYTKHTYIYKYSLCVFILTISSFMYRYLMIELNIEYKRIYWRRWKKKKLSTKINTIDKIRYANLIDLDWKILENSTYKLAASTHNLFRIKAWSNNRFYAVIESSIQDEEWTKNPVSALLFFSCASIPAVAPSLFGFQFYLWFVVAKIKWLCNFEQIEW